jgi:hypothetical protein
VSESIGLRFALGLAAIGQILVLLGIAGLLRPWVLWALFVAIAIFAIGRVARARPLRWPWLAAIAAAIVPFLLLALFPPIAFDETLYHLPFVQALARSGSITFLGNLRFPAFPQLHELLCVPILLALGDTATHLVALAEAIILALLLLDSTSGHRRTAGILAAALCLGHPIMVQLATVTYVEVALTLFVAAALVCLDRICLDRMTDPASARYAAAAGFFLGTACSVKHLGWYFAVAGFAFVLLFDPARKRTVPLFLCALAIAVLPAYGEIVHLTGNPVHPFLGSIFGANPWALPGGPPLSPAARATAAVRLFWDVTFARERVNQQPHYSPLFALSFAILLLAATRNRRAAFVAAVCAGYIVIFTYLPQDSRYLLPLLPIVSIVAARVVASWLREKPRANTIAAALSLFAIAPAYAYAGYRLAKQGLPPVTAAQRTAYLERRIPEYRTLQRRSPGITYQCGAEHLQAFGDTLLGDWSGPVPVQKVLGESRDATGLARTLRRIGARELLISRTGRCPVAWQELPREPYFRLIYEDEGAALWRVTAWPPPTGDSAR